MSLPPGRPSERLVLWLGLEPYEGQRLLLMAALVAVLLCAQTIAKVLRDALFLAEFGALALIVIWVSSRDPWVALSKRNPDVIATSVPDLPRRMLAKALLKLLSCEFTRVTSRF